MIARLADRIGGVTGELFNLSTFSPYRRNSTRTAVSGRALAKAKTKSIAFQDTRPPES